MSSACTSGRSRRATSASTSSAVGSSGGVERDGVGEHEAGAVRQPGEGLERGLAPGVEVEQAGTEPLFFEPDLEHGALRPAPHLVADGGGLGEGVEPGTERADERVGALDLVERVVGPLDLECEVERERIGLVARDLGPEIGRALAEGERARPRDHLLDAPLRPLRAERRHERVRKRRHRNRRIGQRADLRANLGARGGFEPGRAERRIRRFDLGEQVAEAERGRIGGLGAGPAGEGEPEVEGAGQQRATRCTRGRHDADGSVGRTRQDDAAEPVAGEPGRIRSAGPRGRDESGRAAAVAPCRAVQGPEPERSSKRTGPEVRRAGRGLARGPLSSRRRPEPQRR